MVSPYIHLKKIDLSHNQLKGNQRYYYRGWLIVITVRIYVIDLSPLTYLRNLTDIDVSHNRVCHMMTFTPPTNIQVSYPAPPPLPLYSRG